MNNNLFATTIIKALDILNCFSDDQQEIGISELSADIGLPVSSVHRLIQSLEFEGFLLQNKENKKYLLGTRFLALSKKSDRFQRFEQVLARYADQLCQLTGESVNVTICSAAQIFHIYTAPSPYVLRPNFPLYTAFPAYNTSVGRVFLSEMSDAALEWVYENNAENIHMPLDQFLDMLHQVKAQGYALDDEAFNVGLRCVGAPIRMSCGTVIFAISISAPTSRMDDARYLEARETVVQYANRISQEIQALE